MKIKINISEESGIKTINILLYKTIDAYSEPESNYDDIIGCSSIYLEDGELPKVIEISLNSIFNFMSREENKDVEARKNQNSEVERSQTSAA